MMQTDTLAPAETVAEGKYLYCLIDAPAPDTFASPGIGGRGDVVHTITVGRLAAVVSDSPRIEYENSRRNMMAHTKVLEEVMARHTMLPVCFGTVATGPDPISGKILEGRRDELVGLLEQMRGRLELGLKATWREDVIFAEILQENPAIAKLRDSLVGRSPEKSHFERIRLGEMIGQAMERKRRDDEERILERVRPFVHKTKLNKPIGDRMILNAAVLVEAAREAGLDQAVRQMDAEWGARLSFKYVGPVPPYNFVTITIHW
ncbi:GvpL/GvpF family gas vesicle protein [Aquabacter spiritensis]|uniref:Gas vesicle protein GvpL/GvpF n=1 Tax=Aquabacter spiritensis TaxID=933073 RepID=A0A4R3LPA5_9HYPH|nr:GvpL/GvpF family gas vesicle protein [Aquabacter spiritensis]TCT02264.1 gas vesicle protein GvpL/GvpF [Aquabacter spiritensis]